MVKFKQHRIRFAAVYAWMVTQVFEYLLDYFRFSGTTAARHVRHMTCLVSGIPVSLYYPLALFTLRVKTVYTSSIMVKIPCAFQR